MAANTITLGDEVQPLVVRTAAGSPFSAALQHTNDAGSPTPWPDGTVLVLNIGSTAFPAEVDGDTASWSLSAAQVDATAAATEARLWLNGVLWAYGPVIRLA